MVMFFRQIELRNCDNQLFKFDDLVTGVTFQTFEEAEKKINFLAQKSFVKMRKYKTRTIESYNRCKF